MSDTEATEGESGGDQFVEPLQNFLSQVQQALKEAQVCFDKGNKSAGRRARKLLGEVKKAITPLRAEILEKMKGGG